MDPLQELANSPDAEMFSTGEPDESSLVPVLERRSFVDDIFFGGETFDSCLATLDRLLARFEECRISVSFTKSLFIKSNVDFLSHEVSRVGVRADPKTMQTIAALPFPTSKKGMQSFLGALNYYGRFIQDFAVYGAALYQLKDGDFDISTAAGRFTSCSRKCAGAKCYTTPGTRVDASPGVVPGPRAEGRGDGLSPCGERGSLLADDAEGVGHDARWQAYQSVHADFYPGVADQVEATVRASCPVRCHAIALASGDREGARKDVKFAQLLQSTVTSFVDLEDSLAPVAPPSRGSATLKQKSMMVMAAVRGFCGAWTIVTAASAFLESTTVNIAEYTGMNQGVKAAIDNNIDDLIIVGDARLAIQQSLGVIACRKETLQTQLNHHKELTAKLRSVRYLHVVRDYNAAADSLETEALESKTLRQVRDPERLLELQGLNRIHQVIYEPSSNTVEVPDTIYSLDVVHSLRASFGLQRKTFENFVDSDCEIVSVMTRQQANEPSQRTPKASRHAGKTSGVPGGATEMNIGDQSTSDVSRGNAKEPSPAALAAPFCDDRAIPTSGDASGEPSQANGEPSITLNEQSQAPSASDVDPVAVQAERRRRIGVAQSEEARWRNIKAVLTSDTEKLSYREARDAWKWSDKFVLTEDDILYYAGSNRRRGADQGEGLQLRLVVPTTMVQEVLQNCHDSLEGGHQGVVRTYQRVKKDYYWSGLYSDVEKHVRSCSDCSTSKSRPQLRGYSPGNILAERPFQIVSMDFVIPLPKSRRGNTVLLLFQCAFTGYVIAKAMADTSALKVAQAFEGCVYRRFGAPSMIRHDRDPRFMSEVFQTSPT
ncbi:hypothetical protein PC128_g8269 [Phytophthora cactorum]|nr:hypothetical protein PC128_g8269 [Phytophthora cactorum]